MSVSPEKKALRISLAVSLVMFTVKAIAFFLTSSTAALSDAAESIVHIFSVGFVYYGFILSKKRADEKHLYGHESIEFLSVGIEGLSITAAGILIIYESIQHLIFGHQLQNIVWGIIFLSAAGLTNLIMGSYLLKVGRREDNMIVISNGKHTLTDVWTTFGAVATLLIVKFTGWILLDTLVGLGIGLYIIYEAYKLLRYAVNGIMNRRDPEADKAIREQLRQTLPGTMTGWHYLRHRTTGHTTWIEFHAVFEKGVTLKKAHEDATKLERELIDALKGDVIVTIHLEPEGTHKDEHKDLKDADQKRPLDDYI
ncbi:MAG TPA: cation diffusion facilitator family transporter [Balneolaceae bacterium]|nr:cation diffusion facilitator family transporter [Balneolaceae bacterium]